MLKFFPFRTFSASLAYTASTAGCKEWSYDSWVMLTRMLKEQGYQVVCVTHKPFLVVPMRI